MPGIPAWLITQAGKQITVEPFEGTGGNGDVFGPPFTVTAIVDNKRRMVRAATGTEVVSEATLYLQRGVNIPLQSRVTLPDRVTYVATVRDHDGGRLPVPSHLEVALL